MTHAFLPGFLLGLSLILAIGAQNAFVLRQGLRQQYVFAVSLTCALSDAILIAAGVAGFGAAVAALPWLETAMRYGGAAFLFLYAARSRALQQSRQPDAVRESGDRPGPRSPLAWPSPGSIRTSIWIPWCCWARPTRAVAPWPSCIGLGLLAYLNPDRTHAAQYDEILRVL